MALNKYCAGAEPNVITYCVLGRKASQGCLAEGAASRTIFGSAQHSQGPTPLIALEAALAQSPSSVAYLPEAKAIFFDRV
jgi:hypothetical protein